VTGSNGKSIFVTAIDQCGAVGSYDAHFDFSYNAFYELFGQAGVSAGHGIASFEVSSPCNCKGNRDCKGIKLEEAY
jgi:hypothetical protein